MKNTENLKCISENDIDCYSGDETLLENIDILIECRAQGDAQPIKKRILENEVIREIIAKSHYFDDGDCSKLIIPFPTYEDACLFSIKVLGKELNT